MDFTAEDAEENQEFPPVSGGPPALVWKKGSSSSVPDLPTTTQASHLILLLSTEGLFTVAMNEYESEEEKMPEPWNFICIVGVRVYSRDETLELRTVMEAAVDELTTRMLPKAKVNDDRSYPPLIFNDGKGAGDEST
ncbi:hypothetical protein FOYG_17423 [Fusarium oxysporum NRRL 32931]|uniref:Uncharacterized protein n=1 Tax=Fusarium oxysporum NRRL 32931 TaxID=660029 RepID=W9HA46_FUSOX|nr:hypothetical protein FOYG_17423 [Fusarium oxysporum NRRL 32931]